MGSLGEMLRQARLDRGASLADAEHETRIRRKYLEALESEDYGSLPATVYTRGFVRTYARFLGLDQERALDLYAPGRAREERLVLRPATPQLTAGRTVSMRVFTALAGAILASLLLVYLWTQYNSFVDSLGQAERSAAGRAVVPTPVAKPAGEPSPASVTATTVPTAVNVAAPAAVPERGVVLEVRVTERTWMEVWIDGVSQLQTTLPAGSVRSFTANQSIRMRVGNAGVVQVTVNGEPQGVLGERLQVKELVWER
jgi:cytoskeleton protein RodZ